MIYKKFLGLPFSLNAFFAYLCSHLLLKKSLKSFDYSNHSFICIYMCVRVCFTHLCITQIENFLYSFFLFIFAALSLSLLCTKSNMNLKRNYRYISYKFARSI